MTYHDMTKSDKTKNFMLLVKIGLSWQIVL